MVIPAKPPPGPAADVVEVVEAAAVATSNTRHAAVAFSSFLSLNVEEQLRRRHHEVEG